MHRSIRTWAPVLLLAVAALFAWDHYGGQQARVSGTAVAREDVRTRENPRDSFALHVRLADGSVVAVEVPATLDYREGAEVSLVRTTGGLFGGQHYGFDGYR